MENNEFYIWKVSIIEGSDQIDDQNYSDYIKYNGDIFKIPKPIIIIKNKNIILFDEIKYSDDHQSQIMILYDDNSLEFYHCYEIEGCGEYHRKYQYQFPIDQLICSCYDYETSVLYLYVNMNDIYQLIRFDTKCK